MNLVCFPGLTGGALMCNLLNKIYNPIDNLIVKSREHNVFKTSKENGFDTYVNYDESQWNLKISWFEKTDLYFGTHCHPSVIKSLDKFKKIVVITVTTNKSKFYRFLRNIHVNNIKDENEMYGHAQMIIQNNFTPYPDCINVEFEDVVNGEFVRKNNLDIDYFNNWKKHNIFLYEPSPKLTNIFEKALTGEHNAI